MGVLETYQEPLNDQCVIQVEQWLLYIHQLMLDLKIAVCMYQSSFGAYVRTRFVVKSEKTSTFTFNRFNRLQRMFIFSGKFPNVIPSNGQKQVIWY